MTTDSVNGDAKEITVSMPEGMVARIDELCHESEFGSRGQVVAEAIHEAADGN